ncbi:hypothetical protein J6590_017534 [Homalodisca vitripennis]|nr:hypothetical protein J6590_017534 [Homalodisca vitripennis]
MFPTHLTSMWAKRRNVKDFGQLTCETLSYTVAGSRTAQRLTVLVPLEDGTRSPRSVPYRAAYRLSAGAWVRGIVAHKSHISLNLHRYYVLDAYIPPNSCRGGKSDRPCGNCLCYAKSMIASYPLCPCTALSAVLCSLSDHITRLCV